MANGSYLNYLLMPLVHVISMVISCLPTTSHRIYSTWNLTAGLGSIQLLDPGSKAREKGREYPWILRGRRRECLGAKNWLWLLCKHLRTDFFISSDHRKHAGI